MSLNLLTQEEREYKPEIVSITEQILDAEGIECDSKISELSEDNIRKILAEVRKRLRRKSMQVESVTVDKDEEKQKEEERPVIA